MQTQITISGYVVGSIWMPNVEGWKDFTYDLTMEAERKEGATFRDHVVDICNDGDFRSCGIAQGVVTITRRKGARRVTRDFPLSMFPSVQDCMYSDPDWLPDFGEEYE